MKVYGSLERAQVENVSALPTAGIKGRIVFLTTVGKTYIDDGTSYVELGSGGAGGSINYISSNSDAETSTTGWVTYKDAAAATPADGTGGSPTLTFTRSASSPLRGTASFLITTTAANLQGEGASFDFTVPAADQAKVISISFDYKIASGTYADGDMTIYIYDVTNSTLIQPAGYSILGASSSSVKQIATFQTSATGTSYRLIFHRAVSTASAMTMKIDNVVVGPQVVQYGAPITDWVSFTPTGAWSTNTTYTGRYRRVGDSAEIEVSLAMAGAPNPATLTTNMPTGLVIDASKMSLGTSDNHNLGEISILDSGNTNYVGKVRYNNTTSVTWNYLVTNATSDLPNVTQAAPIATIASGDVFTCRYRVAIVGWSSAVQMSNDTDTRTVSAIGDNATPNSTPVSGANTALTWATTPMSKDTHGGWSTSNNNYVVQVPGYYDIDFTVEVSSTSTTSGNKIQASILAGGNTFYGPTNKVWTTGANLLTANIHLTQYLTAGQTITFKVQSTLTGTLSHTSSDTGTYFSISRRSGPSAIAASEKILAKYQSTTTTSMSSGTQYAIDFSTKVIDTHGAVTATGAHNSTLASGWKFLAPAAGYYRVNSNLRMQGISSWNLGEYLEIGVFKNGTNVQYNYRYQVATHTETVDNHISTIVQCVAGDTLQVELRQTSGTSGTISGTATENWVEIEKIN